MFPLPPPTHWLDHLQDITTLRDLLRRKRDLAQSPGMAERRRLWSRHASRDAAASLNSQRPMILIETSGVLDEVIPLHSLRCQTDWARSMERTLRDELYRAEYIRDDFVVEPWIQYQWDVTVGDFGVKAIIERGDNGGKLGSYHWDPPIKDLDRDFDKLRFRTLSVNREKTANWKDFLEGHFGDILPVRMRSWYWWTSGLTWTAIDLIGLEQFMLAMMDNPVGLHRLMAFLRDEFLHFLDWFEQEGLLSLNNENDYVGSGSLGYSDELPQTSEAVETHRVSIRDIWGLCESQETVGVSPRMFEEFVFQYQIPIAARYGLLYYGCCEPLHQRIHIIKQLPNLRRVSVSPWCNRQKMVDVLGDGYIYCCKPNPALISTEVFDEDAIREDLCATLRVCKDLPLELVMKDVHTVNDQPWRMGRWVQLARQVCAEFGTTDSASEVEIRV